MADATSREPAPVRTSKRKRDHVSYLVDDHCETDGEPASESDPEDLTFGSKRTAKKQSVRKTKKTPVRKVKQQRPFRFLDLPAELRDEIYELALVEPNGLTLVSRTKYGRRGVGRGGISIHETFNYYGKTHPMVGRWLYDWGRSGSFQNGVESRGDRHLIPNLLAVCQQIRTEATPFLYKQEIMLEDTTALLQFIATIGTYNRQVVKDLIVREWGVGRGHNFTAFTMLASCVNLHSLYLHCTVGYYGRAPKKLAGQIYRDGHHFLEAYATVNGLDSALKVVQFNDWQFAKTAYSQEPEFDRSKRDEFELELERLMKKGSRF